MSSGRVGGGVATKSMVNEIALLSEVAESQVSEIFRAAGVMFVITLTVSLVFGARACVSRPFPRVVYCTDTTTALQGLALGFVLLRVESLVEAGNKE